MTRNVESVGVANPPSGPVCARAAGPGPGLLPCWLLTRRGHSRSLSPGTHPSWLYKKAVPESLSIQARGVQRDPPPDCRCLSCEVSQRSAAVHSSISSVFLLWTEDKLGFSAPVQHFAPNKTSINWISSRC